MKKAIIVDIDGTLANIDHRRHFLTEYPKKHGWSKFNKCMQFDPVNEWCRALIISFRASGYAIILVSGRSNEFETKTMDWLKINDIQYDVLLMRMFNDYRSDDVIKEEIYTVHIKNNYEVCFCVDDRDRTVKKWRELGLVCLQCNYGDF